MASRLRVGAVVALGLLAASGCGNDPVVVKPKVGQLPRSGSFRDPKLGVVFMTPEHWAISRRRGTVRAVSEDRTSIVAISALPGGRGLQAVVASATRAIRRNYRFVHVLQRSRRKVAGRPAVNLLVSAVNPSGVRLRILANAVAGSSRPYLVEVFSAQGAPPRRLVEAQVLLSSLKLGE
jgi:hypothetical protein